MIGLVASSTMFAQQSLQYDVWHVHSRSTRVSHPRAAGTLTLTDSGVSFQEQYKAGKTPKHPHAWHWDYQDIEQLKVEPKALTVVTYKSNKWKLGAHQAYHFDLASEQTFNKAAAFLKQRLDQRFVAVVSDDASSFLWEIPAKHRMRLGGDEGVLQVGTSEIVYKSAKQGESRTWRYEDIDNIARNGPFDLMITTFERARLDYGSRKQFNFELKRPLDEARYNDLWLRLNQSKGLKVLSSYREDP
jgi:hypothetical protein